MGAESAGEGAGGDDRLKLIDSPGESNTINILGEDNFPLRVMVTYYK